MNQKARLLRAGLPLALSGVIALVALTFMSPRFFPSQADELHSVWPAQRALRGAVPYVDVFTHRPPLDLVTNALALAILGETLNASRILQVVSMVVAGLLLFALLRRWGAGDWEAAVGALIPSCLLFPAWPLPSSHWQSLPFALGAILLLESARGASEGAPSRARLLGAGFLAGLAGLTIQTAGAVACAWLLLRSAGGPAPRRELPLLCAGIALPLALCAGVLLALGALGAAFECTVVFPLFHYKAGFNDVSFGAEVLKGARRAYENFGALGAALCGLTLALPFGALALGTFRALRLRQRQDVASVVWLVVVVAVFFKGRSDWSHIMLFLPYVLVGLCELALRADTPVRARRAAGVWLLLCLTLAGGRWLVLWSRGVSPGQALEADGNRRAYLARILEVLPPELRDEPLLSLPYGAGFYFFRDADAPSIDWVYLPSVGYTLPQHHQDLADWLERGPVPVVVVFRNPRGLGFLSEPSPLKDALQNYEEYAVLPSSVILVRKSVLERLKAERVPR